MRLTTLFFILGLLFTFNSNAQILTESDLIGQWRCDSYLHGSIKEFTPSPIVEKWQASDDGMFLVLSGTNLTFSRDNGGFTVQSSTPNPVLFSSEQAIASSYRIRDNLLSMTYNAEGVNFLYELNPVDSNHFRLRPTMSGTYPILSCSRTGTAATTSEPTVPTTTTATTTAKQDAKKSAKVE